MSRVMSKRMSRSKIGITLPRAPCSTEPFSLIHPQNITSQTQPLSKLGMSKWYRIGVFLVLIRYRFFLGFHTFGPIFFPYVPYRTGIVIYQALSISIPVPVFYYYRDPYRSRSNTELIPTQDATAHESCLTNKLNPAIIVNVITEESNRFLILL